MLHIVFFILKLILFLMLAALAVILAVLSAVLLAPVRYQGEASLHERFLADGKISWLFHLIGCTFSYGEEGLKTEFRILWFHPFQEKQEAEPEMSDRREPDGNRQQEGSLTEDSLEGAEDRGLVTAMEDEAGEDPGEQEVFPGPTEFAPSAAEGRAGESREKREQEESRSGHSEGAETGRQGLLRRLADKAEQAKKRFCLAVRRLKKACLNLKYKKDSLSALLSDEKNQRTFHLLISEAKRLCRKLFPRVKGSIAFGVEDPYLMGQLLAVMAFLYPFYGASLETAAVFNENVLEGDISVKGRFRFGTFAVSGLRILRDRNFRTLMKRFLREGGV